MQEFEVGKLRKLCFLVKKGTSDKGKNIVVPYDNLADIDRKRFFDMEKQGGELMRVMRDTTLDNGVNALVMYADMLVEVDVANRELTQKDRQNITENKAEEKEQDDFAQKEHIGHKGDAPVVRKSRGRPRGSKNKSKS